MLPGFPPRRPAADLDVQFADLRAVVIDFETTGLYPNQGDEIIEAAAVHVDGFMVCEDRGYETLLNPGRRVSQAAFEVHNISDQMLEGEPEIADVLPRFMSHLEDRVVVGQNVVFDVSFLVHSLEECSLPPLRSPILDTGWISRLVFPKAKRHSLDAIAGRLRLEKPKDRHRAMGDALWTSRILVRLLQRCQNRGYTRVGDLMEAYRKLEEGCYGDGEVFELIERCFKKRQGVEIAYAGRGYSAPEAEKRRNRRKVDIYHVSPPYFLGFCHKRNAIRTFRIDRVARVQPLDVRYGIPDGFHPQDHFLRWAR